MAILMSYRLRRGFFGAVLNLLGHLAGAALMFTGLFFLGWLVSVVLHLLDTVHPFPPPILDFMTRIELWLVYADTFLAAIVVLAGAARFVRDIIFGVDYD